MSFIRRYLRPFLPALIATFLTAGTSPLLAAEKVNIVAAQSFYADVARQIGGDRVHVTSVIANPDIDPHLFEPTPAVARDISDATIVIYNGADYDHWMEKLLDTSTRKGRITIAAADLANYKSGNNPHLWYAPDTLPAVARALAAELAKHDKAHSVEFMGNLARFEASFAKLTTRISEIRAKHKGVKVTATEPVFGYMIHALGLDNRNEAFQTAVMNDVEPSPTQIAGFEKSLKDGSVKILFYNNQVTDDTTRRMMDLARENKVAIIGVSEMPPAGRSVQDWFGDSLDEIARVLDGMPK